MTYDRFKHHRRSIRLKGYDYTRPGAYYITICVWDRECLFGEIRDGRMNLNRNGEIARDIWMGMPDHFSGVESDQYVIMPNHIHGIIVIPAMIGGLSRHTVGAGHLVGARHAVPLHTVNLPNTVSPRDEPQPAKFPPQPTSTESFGKPVSESVPTMIRSYKSAVTKNINQSRGTTGSPVWQRNYYEHIIRDRDEFNRTRQYIMNNPNNWNIDIEHPANAGTTNRVSDDFFMEK